MIMQLIEKKGQPVRTRYKFTRKEWKQLAEPLRRNFERLTDVHFTARMVWFDVEGDKLNTKKRG